MNKEEFGVLEFLNIGRVLSDCLDYCLSQGEDGKYSLEIRTNLGNRLKQLTREKSNFDINCDNNGDNGKQFKEEMGYFIDDVFSDNGDLVKKSSNSLIQLSRYFSSPVMAAALALFSRNVCLLNAKHHSLSPNGIASQSIFWNVTGFVQRSISYFSVKVNVFVMLSSAWRRTESRQRVFLWQWFIFLFGSLR